MNNRLTALLLCAFQLASAQQLQLHYDFRHSIDPDRAASNFLSFSFEYFKSNDSTGSFLLKLQTDFNGARGNPGQCFLQVSKDIRLVKSGLSLSLNYSGGLGLAPPSYGYYITNSLGAGLAWPFPWGGSWWSAGVLYRYNAFRKASHDVQFNVYFWKGFFHYRLQISGSVVAWTQNRDLGEDFTRGQRGKKFEFFGDPQIWFRVRNKTFIGTRINLFYHVFPDVSSVLLYPTIGLKQEL